MPKTRGNDQSNDALTGGYYWFPAPGDGQVKWSVLTCYDLGYSAGWSHSDMWPAVIDRLARAWGREVAPLRKRLELCCYGLSRGRITQPEGHFLLLHGDDAPVSGWRAQVLKCFRLNRRSVRLLYDEHERTFTEHCKTVFEEFGLPDLSARRMPRGRPMLSQVSPMEQTRAGAGRTIAIGDIHGSATALRTLIDSIDPGEDDTVVVLGDVIDYGADTRGAIQQLLDLSRRCRLILLKGNHEEMLFNGLNGRDDRRYWESCGGIPTRRSYPECGDDQLIDPEHLEFLRKNCRDYFETDRFIFVHANYYPNRPMHEQSGHTLRWEFVDPHRMARHFSGKTAVVGHTTRTDGDVLDLGFLVMIDTGASMGGWLTALEVNAGEIIQTNQQGEVRRSRRLAT